MCFSNLFHKEITPSSSSSLLSPAVTDKLFWSGRVYANVGFTGKLDNGRVSQINKAACDDQSAKWRMLYFKSSSEICCLVLFFFWKMYDVKWYSQQGWYKEKNRHNKTSEKPLMAAFNHTKWKRTRQLTSSGWESHFSQPCGLSFHPSLGTFYMCTFSL